MPFEDKEGCPNIGICYFVTNTVHKISNSLYPQIRIQKPVLCPFLLKIKGLRRIGKVVLGCNEKTGDKSVCGIGAEEDDSSAQFFSG